MVAATLLFHRVLIIADVLSVTVPADAVWARFCLLLGVDERLETLIEAGVRLQHVHDVELVVDSLADIGNLEVIPLRVSRSVIVVSQKQVVLVIANFLSASQVARFETRLKDQSSVIVVFLSVVRAELGVITINFHDLRVEVALLARRTVRIVLALIHRVLFLRNLNKIILVNIWRRVCISASVLFGSRRELDAVVHDPVVRSNVTVITFLGFNSRIFFDDGRRVDWSDGLVRVTQIVETRPVHHERILDTGARKLYWLATVLCVRFLLPCESLLLCWRRLRCRLRVPRSLNAARLLR